MLEAPYKLKRPAELEKYILDIADKNYLIYSKKSGRCYCTCCNRETDFKSLDVGYVKGIKLKHNSETICLRCGKLLTMKSEGYGREGLEEHGRVLWFRRKGAVTYAQLDEYDISYTDFVPKVWYWPSAQYKFSAKGNVYYKHAMSGNWIKGKDVKLPSANHGSMPWFIPKYEKTTVYLPSLKTIGTDLKYATLVTNTPCYLQQYYEFPEFIITYYDLFLRYPSIEILEKSGFEKIVVDRIVGNRCKYIRWNRKNLKEILNMPPAKIKELRKYLNDDKYLKEALCVVKAYHEVRKRCQEDYSVKEAVDLSRYTYDNTLEIVKEVTTIRKAFDYLKKQPDMNIGDYADYIRECYQLNRDLRQKKILRPDDLKKEHDKNRELIYIQTSAEELKNFKKKSKALVGAIDGFEYNGLIAITAKSPLELKREGDEQHHCVGGKIYTERTCEGLSAIVFIRKKSNPEKAYYTVEVTKTYITPQVRGFANVASTPEIDEFVKQMIAKLKKENSKMNKKRRAA